MCPGRMGEQNVLLTFREIRSEVTVSDSVQKYANHGKDSGGCPIVGGRKVVLFSEKTQARKKVYIILGFYLLFSFLCGILMDFFEYE